MLPKTPGRKSLLLAVLAIAALVVAAPSPALAYLDPVSGSMILQVVLGAIAAGALLIKTFWRRIVSFFSPRQDGGEGNTG